MMDFEHCAHGAPLTGRCPKCIEIGLANVGGTRRNECWRATHIQGQRCPHPRQQSAGGCGGCAEFFNCKEASRCRPVWPEKKGQGYCIHGDGIDLCPACQGSGEA